MRMTNSHVAKPTFTETFKLKFKTNVFGQCLLFIWLMQLRHFFLCYWRRSQVFGLLTYDVTIRQREMTKPSGEKHDVIK